MLLTTLKRYWQADGWIWLGALLVAVPVFIPDYPPLVDLPQHAAQVATLSDLLHGTSHFESLYRINWFTPYLFGYLLVAVLMPLAGIAMACKIVVAASLAAFPLATAALLGSVGVDRRWAWLTVPTAYSLSFQWGFLNFIVAAPIGLLFLAAVMRHHANPRWRTGVWVAVGLLFLFFAHALICLVFITIAAADAMVRGGGARRIATKLAALLPVVPLAAGWGILTYLSESQVQQPIFWALGWQRISQLPVLLLANVGSTALLWVVLATLALPFLYGMKISREPWRHVPWFFCTILYLTVPVGMFGVVLVYPRLAMFLIPFLLMTLTPRTHPHWTPRLPPTVPMMLVSMVWIALFAASMNGVNGEIRAYEQVIAHAQPQKRMLQLMVDRDSHFLPAPIFLHFGSWYQAEQSGVVDFSFAYFPNEIVRYREEHPSPLPMGLEWQPTAFNWREHGGAKFDYFLVRGHPAVVARLFDTAPRKPELVARSRNWWLFHSARDPAAPDVR